MKEFLRHLKAAWRYGTEFPYATVADSASFWTNEDAQSTEHFFTSPTGRKLSSRLTNYAIKMALAAVQNPNCSPYVNGQASGVSACFAAIEAHYPQREEQEQSEAETALNAMEVAAQ